MNTSFAFRLPAVSLCIFVFLCLTKAQADTIPFIESHIVIDKGLKFYDEERFGEAILEYEKVSRNDTNYAVALVELARACMADSQYARAIGYAKEGLKTGSRYDMLFYEYLIITYGNNNQSDEAIKVFEEGAQKFPHDFRLFHNIGMVYNRAKRVKEAAGYFQEAIRINPVFASSHYMLGVICAYNDHFVPAMLSLQIAILIEPEADRALQALIIMEQIAKNQLKNNPDSIQNIINSPAENDFSELETVIRSQAALNSKYKTRVKLGYTELIKQMQVLAEQIRYRADDKGFWMQHYVPFFTALWAEKYFEPFAYYLFSSLASGDKQVKAEIARNASAIKKMGSRAGDLLRKPRENRIAVVGGKSRMVKHWYYTNGLLQAVGDYDEKLQSSVGDWKFYHDSGYPKAEGTFTGQGKKTGIWRYYYVNGNLSEVETFKDGISEGPDTTYHFNGRVKQQQHFSANKLNGMVKAFHETGAPYAEVMFKDGQKEGKAIYYHKNGVKESEAVFKNDMLEGLVINYYDNGQTESEATMVTGKSEGLYRYYYPSGKLNYEGNMTKGERTGEWKWYHENGQLSKTGSYIDGKEEGLWISYYENAKTESEMTYKSGLLQGSNKDYDEDGILYSDWEYNKGDLLRTTYYNKSGEIISSSEEKGDVLNLAFYYPNGMKAKEGKTVRDRQSGVWKEYFISGKLYAEIPYTDGQKNGLAKYYFVSGELSEEINYEKGLREGYYKSYYKNGNMMQEGWHKNDEPEGTWIKYFSNGIMNYRCFYQDGKQTGYEEYYHPDGTKESEVYSEYGYFTADYEFDSAGNVISESKLQQGNGQLKLAHRNAKQSLDAHYKYGKKDGEIRHYYANGTLKRVDRFANGYKEGKSISYHDNGKIFLEGEYKYDKREGLFTMHDEEGKLTHTMNYSNGDLEGEWKWFYPNGNTEIAGTYRDDNRDGYFSYYHEDGSLRYRLHYAGSKLIGYTYFDKEGNFINEIPVLNQTAKIVAYYQNGSISAELNYVSDLKEGKQVYYHPNGKLESEEFFKSGEREGSSRNYHPNGNLKEDETYFYDERNGICRYYTANGMLSKEIPYLLDLVHGRVNYYENGRLSRTVRYEYDEPYE